MIRRTIVPQALAVLLVLAPLVSADGIVVRTITDETPTAPPPGYYYDPPAGIWYYYDGQSAQPKPPGFVPPPGQETIFDVHPADRGDVLGWELQIVAKYIGSHTVYYDVEYFFDQGDGPFCAVPGETPPCHLLGAATTKNFPVQAPFGVVILGYIDFADESVAGKPNTGQAEAWGWLDDSQRTPDQDTYHAQPTTW